MMRRGNAGRQTGWPGARSHATVTIPGGEAPGALSCGLLVRPAPVGPVTSRARPERSLPHLARKPNYDFEKRRKEEERRKKKAAKREERLERKRAAAAAGEPEPADDESADDANDG